MVRMPRTIWKGSLSFGLVNIPVGVYPATQDKSIHFNQFEKGTSDRIRYKKVNERTGKEVDAADIVKGVDLGGGEYVILSDDELAAAEPERSRAIEITDFVDLDEIDPVYFNTTYYLAPEGEPPEARPTRSFARRCRKPARWPSPPSSCATRSTWWPSGRTPTSSPSRRSTSPTRCGPRPGTAQPPRRRSMPSAQELKMANLLIESMESKWDPERYHDTHRAKVEALIEEKAQGKTIAAPKSARPSKVVDLMEALSASIKASEAKSASARAKNPRASAKRAPANAAAAKAASKARTASSSRRKAS